MPIPFQTSARKRDYLRQQPEIQSDWKEVLWNKHRCCLKLKTLWPVSCHTCATVHSASFPGGTELSPNRTPQRPVTGSSAAHAGFHSPRCSCRHYLSSRVSM